MQDLTIGLVQYDILWEQPQKNLEFLEELLYRSAPADLILLPEMFNTGFSMEAAKVSEEESGPALQWLLKVSAHLNCAIGGSVAIREGNNYFNRFLVADCGKLICRYDKHHLFSMAGEEKIYTAGSEQVIFELKGWKIKPLVCYDLRFPIWCYNTAEADLMVFCANWPDARSEHWRNLLLARAIENQCFVAGVNRIGADHHGMQHSGYSAIISPRGITQCEIVNEEGVFVHTLDKNLVNEFRASLGALQEGISDLHLRSTDEERL